MGNFTAIISIILGGFIGAVVVFAVLPSLLDSVDQLDEPYVAGVYNVRAYTGEGTGGTITLVANNIGTNGRLTGTIPAAVGGSGYAVGDKITLESSSLTGNHARLNVKTVSTGVPATYDIEIAGGTAQYTAFDVIRDIIPVTILIGFMGLGYVFSRAIGQRR